MPAQTLGERIAWARAHRRLTLQVVADSSGLNVGYLSQLEKGGKLNPSLDTLRRLALSLEISVSFLMGDQTMSNGDAWRIGAQFAEHLSHLTENEREDLMYQTVETRFIHAVTFLCNDYAYVYTPALLAFELGISLRSLREILAGRTEVSYVALQQLSAITAIPITFFMGEVDLPLDWYRICPNYTLLYMEPIVEAVAMSLTPKELCLAIHQFAQQTSPEHRHLAAREAISRMRSMQQ